MVAGRRRRRREIGGMVEILTITIYLALLLQGQFGFFCCAWQCSLFSRRVGAQHGSPLFGRRQFHNMRQARGSLSLRSLFQSRQGTNDRFRSKTRLCGFVLPGQSTRTQSDVGGGGGVATREQTLSQVFGSDSGTDDDDLTHHMAQLKKENQLLLETVQKLQDDNAALRRHEDEVSLMNQKQHGPLQVKTQSPPRIVLETFEGEGEEWCDSLEEGACPIEPTISFGQAFRERAIWLVGLLVLQSLSGIMLSRNESLLTNHPEIVYFLTMLVGAGGNAGNQASVRVIRGLALETLNPSTQAQFLWREFKMAISLSTLLTSAGFIRALAFATPVPETIAISSALFLIVFSSVCFGAILPLILQRIGIDPAHSSTSIQVIMDILGVFLAVAVSNILLDSPLGVFIMSKLTGS